MERNINKILSTDNSQIKDVIKLRDSFKYRMENKLCFLEGKNLIVDTEKKYISKIFIKEDIDFDISQYENCYIVSDKVYQKLKSTDNSQGIIAIAKTKNYLEFNDILKLNTILFLDSVRDPGNMGTIIRTAEASGIDCIVLTHDCVDITSPKVIRSSMGSYFRMSFHVVSDINFALNEFLKNGYSIYSTELEGGKVYYEEKFSKKSVFIFGNEANGIRQDIRSIVNKKIYIPMSGHIESLNVAIAVSVICFENKRQRSLSE